LHRAASPLGNDLCVSMQQLGHTAPHSAKPR
jgi:hypothetical protein